MIIYKQLGYIKFCTFVKK